MVKCLVNNMQCSCDMNDGNFKVVAKNNKARFDYEILDKYEAGIVLTGSEVKSTRNNNISLDESFVGTMAGKPHLYLFNANITKYKEASYNNHEPRRPRILLLHQREKIKLIDAVQKKGLTIIPLTMYFNNNGKIKLSIALARGKNVVDKRNTLKERSWNINKQRILKTFGK